MLPATATEAPPVRFGVKDVEDGTWKNLADSLSCTQCGRCTSVCPANITGKKLSPRKILIDYRLRINEKGPKLLKDKNFNDNKSYLKDYVSEEEVWACTTCMACVQECPVNIENQPGLILDMRRYLVMEEASAPSNIKTMLTNVENNKTRGNIPRRTGYSGLLNPVKEILKFRLWLTSLLKAKSRNTCFGLVAQALSTDRYKKVTRAFAKILNHLKVNYAVLGTEESCTGDPARRAGNEMLYQMQALNNIELLKQYGVEKIITLCPHCFNTYKNEYPDLGGKYDVLHYTQFLEELMKDGKLKINPDSFKNKKITFHDPCYLGRGNKIYDSPRTILDSFASENVEMKRCKSHALCCGEGGAQMFKEAEKGKKEVFLERIEDVIETKADIVATSCPFCMTMLTDGIKYKNKEEELSNFESHRTCGHSLMESK